MTDRGSERGPEHWDERYAASSHHQRHAQDGGRSQPDRRPGDEVVATLHGVAPGRALDLGAGSGRHAVWLAQRGWQVTALDFSSVAVDLGRANAREADVDERIH